MKRAPGSLRSLPPERARRSLGTARRVLRRGGEERRGAAVGRFLQLAGNLLIVGSIANVIVVDAARRSGIVIDWRRQARTGLPATLVSLCITALWLAWRTP